MGLGWSTQAVLGLASALLGQSATGQNCLPYWSTGFGSSSVRPIVRTLASFDDGTGAQLFIGGDLDWAGGMPADGLVTWRDGVFRRPAGFTGDYVYSSAVYDDGAGPELYLGRYQSPFLQRSSASGWSAVTPAPNNHVFAMKIFDDGTGGALFVGGDFTMIGALSAPGMARFRNGVWSPMGTIAGVRAIEVFDDGAGAALYAGGTFTLANGLIVNQIAKWTGATWAPLGAGVGQSQTVAERVDSLAAFDPDGPGPIPPRLYVAGEFPSIAGSATNGFAVWTGANWAPVPVAGRVTALRVADLGTGPRLYVAGPFTSVGPIAAASIALYDGMTWSPLGAGLVRLPGSGTAAVTTMGVHDDGSGPALFVAGDFHFAGGLGSYSFTKWTGSEWQSLNRGIVLAGFGNSSARAVVTHDEGTGPEVYVTGSFLTAGAAVVDGVAKWNGSRWAALGSVAAHGTALASFDDGTGSALYLGGTVIQIGGVSVQGIAKWRNVTWSNASAGLSAAQIEAFAAHNAGAGPVLHAAGMVTPVGGSAAARVVRWDGSMWQVAGDPFEYVASPNSSAARAMVACDTGSGSRLYAGGRFDRCGTASLANIAAWNGSFWQGVGGGLGGPNSGVFALAEYDDGTGVALWACGSFGALTPTGIARWDGLNWSSPVPQGSSLASGVLLGGDVGEGRSLYVDGRARWDGALWTVLDGGLWWVVGYGSGMSVRGMTRFDSTEGPGVVVVGDFSFAGTPADPLASSRIAMWVGCPETCYPDCNTDGSLTVADFGCFQTKFVGGDPYADCNADGSFTVADFGCFQTKFVGGCP